MSHKKRDVKLGKPVVGRLCACGRPCRKHTFFCGDECRFWAKVHKGPGCWLWTGNTTFSGRGQRYGQFTVTENGQQRHLGAHVFAYEMGHGRVPTGLDVRHTCDVGLCVRPDHLLIGTRAQNNRDAAERNRLHVPRPKAHKLTAEQIHEIRELVTAGQLRVRVAERYGITKGYVTQIMHGSCRQYDAPLQPAQVRRVG